MKKRKHRIVVEVTFDKAVTAHVARRSIGCVLDEADKERTLGNNNFPADIVRTEAKEFDRVFRAEKAKNGWRHPSQRTLRERLCDLIRNAYPRKEGT